ncbi:MAG: cyclase [Rhodobacteraceae bacterium]|nr:cyclase [Paracoccaceae bacterium]
MPIVTTSVELPGLTAEDVWPTLVDFARYPDLMEDVVSVEILEQGETTMLSAWKVLLNGSEFTWEERDHLEPPFLIRFDQTDGDLDVWNGSWQLDSSGAVLVARLTVKFDIGIPSMSEILDPIGERAIRANSIQMLNAVRAIASSRAKETAQ